MDFSISSKVQFDTFNVELFAFAEAGCCLRVEKYWAFVAVKPIENVLKFFIN
jgi:hypothetical protein